MGWPEVLGAGEGAAPLLLMSWYVVYRVNRVVEMCLRAHLDVRAEHEERATMVAVADSLPVGGIAVRFEAGRPAWTLHKHPPGAVRPVLPVGEAA